MACGSQPPQVSANRTLDNEERLHFSEQVAKLPTELNNLDSPTQRDLRGPISKSRGSSLVFQA